MIREQALTLNSLIFKLNLLLQSLRGNKFDQNALLGKDHQRFNNDVSVFVAEWSLKRCWNVIVWRFFGVG